MKKTVKIKHKTPQKKEQKKVMPYNVESMIYYMSPKKHVPVAFIEKFADDQLQYICNNEHVKYINEYYLTRGVNSKLYHDWKERSEYFRSRHDMCLEILGLRREKAMERASALVLRLRQYQYDPAFGKAEEREAELKKRDDSKTQGTFAVIMPSNEKVIDREKYKPTKAEYKDKDSNS